MLHLIIVRLIVRSYFLFYIVSLVFISYLDPFCSFYFIVWWVKGPIRLTFVGPNVSPFYLFFVISWDPNSRPWKRGQASLRAQHWQKARPRPPLFEHQAHTDNLSFFFSCMKWSPRAWHLSMQASSPHRLLLSYDPACPDCLPARHPPQNAMLQLQFYTSIAWPFVLVPSFA